MNLMNAAALTAATLIGAFAAAPSPTQAQDTSVTFALDFIPLGRHAAWYAAKEEGFFAAEGLDVTIIPSQGTSQVMQAIASGQAQFGFVDLPGVVLAQAAGTDIKMITVNYQKAPYAIFSLDNGAAVTEAAQLEGLTLGSGSGSITPMVIAGYMTQQGLDPSTLQIANIAPPARGGALLTGQIPAIEFFVMARPGLEKGAAEAGTTLHTFLLADNGLELYSNGIGAMGGYLEENPEIAASFVRGALNGWKFMLDNPGAAADAMMRNVDGLDRDVILAEIEIVRNLAVTDDVTANGLGWFDPAKMQAGLDFVIQNVGVDGEPPAAGDIYDADFLPAEAVRP